MMSRRRVGLIGTGFMGKAHAIALRSVATAFPDVQAPELACLVDSDSDKATQLAGAWGFARASDDWNNVCADDSIDLVHICTPNHLHKDMALAAIATGKHVFCEKPLALNAQDARVIFEAAREAGVQTSMGFNYACNPLVSLAREMISAGELGEIFSFRGSYFEDYMADPAVPFSWRCLRSQGGSGALADLGTHLINMAEYLLGPITEVLGELTTVHGHRMDPATGESRAVENEDIAQALVKFDRGCSGSMEISRIATGRKCGLCFEISGSKGSLVFDQERMNEIRFYNSDDRGANKGFRTILAGPEHKEYAAFCPAPGHGLGINDLKVIEVRNLLSAIDSGTPVFEDFANGYRVQLIVDLIEQSAGNREWTRISAT